MTVVGKNREEDGTRRREDAGEAREAQEHSDKVTEGKTIHSIKITTFILHYKLPF